MGKWYVLSQLVSSHNSMYDDIITSRLMQRYFHVYQISVAFALPNITRNRNHPFLQHYMIFQYHITDVPRSLNNYKS